MSVASLINTFANATGAGAFPNIRRADVVTGLNARVAQPWTQNQRTSSLCGPSAFLYCLLYDHTEIYVRYVIDLYNTGKAKIGSLDIKPSDKCRRYNPTSIAPVDWIALASLRDSENSVFDYSSVDDTASGITMPHSMAAWFNAAGYSHVENVTNVFFTKGRSDVDKVHHYATQGRRVCLFVNAAVVDYQKQDLGRTFSPNHWVVLLQQGAPVANDKVKIKIYSWGDERQVPLATDMPVKGFCHGFYGYVSAII